MIYFVFAFMSGLKGALGMIKGNWAYTVKHGSQAWGGVKFFWTVTVPILINRKDVVTLLGDLLPIY